MPKGSTFRRNPPTAIPPSQLARIVFDQADSTRDRFMLLSLATEHYQHGTLAVLDLGPSYPNSFQVSATIPIEDFIR